MSHRLVEVGGGTVRAPIDAGVLVARGVPYGRAERFQPPRPAVPWAGEHDGARRGPACPQLPSRLGWLTGPATAGLDLGEQCLVLSVTAPADAESLPVMVWFHGGAYVTGSGESPLYEANSLALDGNVVVVSVSYRLGIFGYLAPEGCEDSQNLGLRDQILALQWVADNVAAFGGDPSRVTAFGQSAGADSVLSLLLCDQSRGLIQRAILQSAPLGVRDGRGPMTTAMRLAADETVAAAAAGTARVDQLLDAQTAAIVAAQRFPTGGMAFAPIDGQAPLPAPDVAAQRLVDAASEFEIAIGYTRHDAAPFAALAQSVDSLDPDAEGVAALTDQFFGAPARDLAETWRTRGGRVLSYRVDWVPAGAPLGACHCIELPLLFGTPSTWASAAMLGPAPRAIDEDLAAELRSHWTGFAHDGVSAWDNPSMHFG